MLVITLLFSLFALPSAYHTEFLQRVSTSNRPQILVLISPGWDEQKIAPLLEHLWIEGFSVWSLRFAKHAQDLEQMSQSIEEALKEHTHPVVIAHGLSSLALLHVLQKTQLHGLAFLGAPIKPFCSPSLKEALQNHTWDAFETLPIQYSSHTFQQLAYTWCERKLVNHDVLDVSHVWSATTNMHPIAPPESIRPHLAPDHRFVRSGPLALHGKEPTAIELIRHKPTLEDLSTWLWQQKPWETP